MKIMIITVAGASTRFSRSVGRPCLKCLYNEDGIEKSLLYRLVSVGSGYDKIIIVSGFKFAELKKAIESHFDEFSDKLILLNNEMYSEYGSGYSLYVGLKKALEFEIDEIVFAEGDLWIDRGEFENIIHATKDVITYNQEVIKSDKAVVLYISDDSRIQYLYDVNHESLEIKEPFTAIYNSGQIWKFVDGNRVANTVENMDEADWKGTNLTFIQGYFDRTTLDAVEFIGLTKWANCNTVDDYRMAQRWNDE